MDFQCGVEPMTSTVHIQRLTAADASALVPDLAALLQDAVASGASIGYLPPLASDTAVEYWREVVTTLRGPDRILLIAKVGDRLAGTVQLDMATRPNGRHRAEVAKLMVHTALRRQGIGRALMHAIEREARQAGRTTLVLDTREGDPSIALYESLGYQKAGTIPEFARSADGSLHPTVFMYKLLR